MKMKLYFCTKVGKTGKNTRFDYRKADKHRTMIHRKADEWIDNHFRNTKKALLLTGARQVGKTYAVRLYPEKIERAFQVQQT